MFDTYLKVPVTNEDELAPIIALAGNTFSVTSETGVKGTKAMVAGPTKGIPATEETIEDELVRPACPAIGDHECLYVLVRFYTPLQGFGNVTVCEGQDLEDAIKLCGV